MLSYQMQSLFVIVSLIELRDAKISNTMFWVCLEDESRED